jgi:hypothetical protein
MAASKRIGALLEIKRRLQLIAKPTFWTDAGLNVLMGEQPVFGPDDPDVAIAVVLGSSTDERQGLTKIHMSRLPLSVQAFASAAPKDGTDPLIAVEEVVADIKRALELEDETLAGWTKPDGGFRRVGVRVIPREEGSEFVGAAVDYELLFEDGWGKP